MERNLKQQAEQMAVRSARQSKSKHLLAIPAVLVAAVTALMLMSPALAMERTAVCGKAEHAHEDACYEQALICGFEQDQLITPEAEDGAEVEAHTHQHTDVCYGPVLVCGIEEHVHDDSCYADEAAETEGEELLVAASPEPVCGIEEHTHEEACYDENGELACGKEEHTHSIDCLADPAETEADPEGEPAEAADIATPETAAPETGDTVEIEEDAAPLEMQTVKVFKDDKVIITATYDPDALPEGAELHAFPITAESHPDEYYRMLEEAGVPMTTDPETGEVTVNIPLVLYNIGFYIGEEEFEPQTPVDVRMQFVNTEEGFSVGDDVTVIHFADEGTEVLESEADSQSNAASFQTGSFSPFIMADAFFPKMLAAAPFTFTGAYNTIDNAVLVAEKYTGDDLGHFLKGIEIKDALDQEVTDGQLVANEKYTFTFTFEENNYNQFDGTHLTYTLPAGIQVSDTQEHGTGTITSNGKDYHYEYWVEGGVLHVQSTDPEGFPTDMNVGLSIEMEGVITNTTGDQIVIPQRDGGNLTFDVLTDPAPEVKKTAGTFEKKDGKYRQNYKVEITARHGRLSGATFTDDLHVSGSSDSALVLEYPNPMYFDITVYDKDGNAKGTRRVQGQISTVDGRPTVTISPDDLPELEIGEKMEISYYTVLKNDYVSDMDQYGELAGVNQNNEVHVKGPKDSYDVQSEATVSFNFSRLVKEGEFVEKEQGDFIHWTVDFTRGLDWADKTAEDTIEGKSDFLTHYSDTAAVTFTVYGEDGKTVKGTITRSWSEVEVSDDGKTLTYKTPTTAELKDCGLTEDDIKKNKYSFKAEYYTHYTASADSNETYKNTVECEVDGHTYKGTDSVIKGVPIGDIEKTVVNKDTVLEDGYIEFQIVVPNIPALGDKGVLPDFTQFRLQDKLRLRDPQGNKFKEEGKSDYYIFVENKPYDLTVTLSEEGKKQLHDPGTDPYGYLDLFELYGEMWAEKGVSNRKANSRFNGEDNNYLLRVNGSTGPTVHVPDFEHGETDADAKLNLFNSDKFTEYGRFYIVFNSDDAMCDKEKSYLKLTKSQTLTVTYKIPLDAKLYADEKTGGLLEGTLRSKLKEGCVLENKAYAEVAGTEPEAAVFYKLPDLNAPVQKAGELQEDGTILYTVTVKNWTVGQDGNIVKFYSFPRGADGKVSGDSEDFNLQFNDKFDETYLAFDDTYQMTASVYEKGELKARYQRNSQTTGVNNENGTISFNAVDFDKRVDIGEGSSQWSDNPSKYGTLADILKNKNHTGNYDIVFTYRLKIKDKDTLELIKQMHQGSVPMNNEVDVMIGSTPGSDKATVEYPTGMLTKTATQQTGTDNKPSDILDFTVEMNENGQTLLQNAQTEENTLTLYDVMSENMELIASSVEVFTVTVQEVEGEMKEVETPFTGFTLEGGITKDLNGDGTPEENVVAIKGLPDGTHIRIRYKARITETGSGVKVSNQVFVEGYDGFESKYGNELDVLTSSGTGTSSRGEIRLTKTDSITQETVSGALFHLYVSGHPGSGEDPRSSDQTPPDMPGSDDVLTYNGKNYYQLGYTVTQDGKVSDNRNIITTEGSTVIESPFFIKNYMGDIGYSFLLVEVKAPEGYELPKDPVTEFYLETLPENAPEGAQVVKIDNFINIPNTPYSTELPETGGEGTTAYTVSGLALLGAALWLYSRRRKAGTH